MFKYFLDQVEAAMEKGYGNRSTSDVIVCLIPSSATVETRDFERKRKRNAESSEGLLATLNLHSERLSHCSKYFQILLDKRWSSSNRKSAMEFFLEVHTDVKYYGDCFSRMYAPNFTGIPSVEHALELLKVASQIECAKVMDEIMGYLSHIPWSVEDESKIRMFPFSKYISSSATSEVNERLRLQLHGTTEESYQRLYEAGQDYLRSNLDSALNYVGSAKSYSNLGNPRRLQGSCEMFAKVFNDIVQCGRFYTLANDAIALVTGKAKDLLLRMPEVETGNSRTLESNFQKICWLFELLLNARGAQELVEHMLSDSHWRSILFHLYLGVDDEICCNFAWPRAWACTMVSIVKQVLAGHLLLKSSAERIALFDLFGSVNLFAVVLLYDARNDAAELLSSFMMTLPHEYQTTKLREWLSHVGGDSSFYVPCEVLRLAHPMWIKDLKRSLNALESARTAEIVAKNPDEAGPLSQLPVVDPWAEDLDQLREEDPWGFLGEDPWPTEENCGTQALHKEIEGSSDWSLDKWKEYVYRKQEMSASRLRFFENFG